MNLKPLSDQQSILLDLLRGAAALFVLIHHVKNGFFASYASLDRATASDVWVSLFYFLTGFGRLPVILFFVLSGFFISRSIFKSLLRHEWSWKRYLIDRVVRLEIVLIPALILTLFWDTLSQAFKAAHSLSSVAIQPDVQWASLIGNICFLQTILVDDYGSNFALWSLSYEFWYYILFPLLLLSLSGLGPGKELRFREVAA